MLIIFTLIAAPDMESDEEDDLTPEEREKLHKKQLLETLELEYLHRVRVGKMLETLELEYLHRVRVG